MKRIVALLLCLSLLCCLIPALCEAAVLTGKVVKINKYGNAILDITTEAMDNAGIALGDVVTVTVNDFAGDMPYLNGYYVDRYETLVLASPGYSDISVCINYGNFSEATGAAVGDTVTITLKEKAGALALQEINNLVYSDAREDYASDEIFANFRAAIDGRLYRSASPIDNQHNRAATAKELIQAAGVKSVMNMSDTEEEALALLAAEDFDSPYYKTLYEEGNVVALGMSIDFISEAFANGIVKGFTFLSEHETPYLVHCVEGKDRTGYAVMLLEMLAGFNTDAIITDYMTTYVNYYGIEVGSEKYDMLTEKNIKEMMRAVAGLEKGASLEGIDWQAAGEQYLLSLGMDADAVSRLKANLV